MCAPLLYSICPRCSYFTVGRSEQMHCPTCGLTLTSRCRRCGTDVPNPYAVFCMVCGAIYRLPLEGGEGGVPSPEREPGHPAASG